MTSSEAVIKIKISILAIIIFFSILTAINTRLNHGNLNVISWDVYGYYLPLPGAFIYDDIRHFSFAEKQLNEYRFSSSIYQLHTLPNGNRVPIYTIGIAITQLPFFLTADIFTLVSHQYARDGLSSPYQWAMIVSGIVYCLIGLIFLSKFLLKYFNPATTSLVLLLLYLGTNYFHYVAYNPGMPHGILFALYCVLIYAIDAWYARPTAWLSIAIGFLYALACLIRPTEVVSVIILVFYGCGNFFSIGTLLRFWYSRKKFLAMIVLAGILPVFLQVFYWHVVTGHWVYNAYKMDGHFFEWRHPHIAEGLFSYRKGWLVYTPIMFFALSGLVLMLVKKQKSSFAIAVYFVINLYIVFSWHLWSYTSSFGMRALVQSYAFLSLPFAFCVYSIQHASKFVRLPLFLVMFFLVALNLFQSWQYQHRILPLDNTTKTYYWKVFGATTRDIRDNKYLDVNEAITDAPSYRSVSLSSFDADQDSLSGKMIVGGLRGILILPKEEFPDFFKVSWVADSSFNDQQDHWFQIKSKLNCLTDYFGEWDNARFVIEQRLRTGKSKWTSIQFQRCMHKDQWTDFNVEVKAEENFTIRDSVKFFLWNQSPDSILIHDIQFNLLTK